MQRCQAQFADIGDPRSGDSPTQAGRSLATVILRASRDLLLPRLVSGDINVTDLDIEVPEARRVNPPLR